MNGDGAAVPFHWPDATEREALRRFLPADGADREVVPVYAPFSGKPAARVPLCTESDVRTAVERAREAQRDWAARPAAERAAVLEDLVTLVLDDRPRVVDAIQVETGKERFTAFEEAFDVASVADYYADRAPGMLSPEAREGVLPGLTRPTEFHRPYGVAGFVSPWNYPLALTVADMLPALVAGNAVVLKPALEAPYTALVGADLLERVGLPADLLQVVPGRGPEVGPALVDAVDYVHFTGGTETGRTIAERAGRALTPVSLELGGKNPFLVLGDADPDRAAFGAARGAFANAGQLCVSFERFYVHEDVYERFLDRFVARAEALTLAADYSYEADVGSLVSAEHRDEVAAAVDGAREAGATVETGGEPRPDVGPWFYAPTVLTDVPPGAELAREEVFGPVAVVEPVGSAGEAIARANDSEYGLNACVWTGDPARGRAVAERVDCGTVGVNDPYGAMWGSTDAPMGGTGDSGIGRRHGREGLLKYVESQSVVVQRGHPLVTPDWVPDGLAARLLSGAARLRHWLE